MGNPKDTPIISLFIFQVLAMSTGKEQRHIPESVCQKYVDYYNNEKLLKEYAEPHFQSIIRRLYKECPEFAEWMQRSVDLTVHLIVAEVQGVYMKKDENKLTWKHFYLCCQITFN